MCSRMDDVESSVKLHDGVKSCCSPSYSRKKSYFKYHANRSKSVGALKYKDCSSLYNGKDLDRIFNEIKCEHNIGTLKQNNKHENSGVPLAKPLRLQRSISFPNLCAKHLCGLSTFDGCKCLFELAVLSNSIGSKDLSKLCHILSSNDNKNVLNVITMLNNDPSALESSQPSSRHSSISTLRARSDSSDSAFSQMSIIDASEIEDTQETAKAGPSNWKAQHSRSRSDVPCRIEEESLSTSSQNLSLPSSLTKDEVPKRKSIFEGQQIRVPTECFFPRPQQGQSLTSFLSSNEFNIDAELDRENAHFYISEALIAAIEQVKCSRSLKIAEEEEESDEEIRNLTQRIRIRRREKQKERAAKHLILLSDGRTDTTSQSASPPASSHSSDFEVNSIGSEDEVEDIELSAHTDSNLKCMKENGLSLSMASLYSDADIHKLPSSHNEKKMGNDSEWSKLTAESVALSLLKKFSEKQLPKASDLQWLVSEQDAPQRLLPLPDSWPVSPDTVEEEYSLEKTRLRGNLEWAPPRPQIIFIIHPNQKRKDVIEKQRYRCAGCGMKIERNYMNRFRYCNYFGKYFCQCCHTNSVAYIPGRILWKWDFTKYYVSKFAWNLLDRMHSDPLFNISDINSNLYRKVRQLESCRVYRMQLFYLKDFIRTCRRTGNIQSELDQNHHFVHEPHMYSLSDLIQVKSGELAKHLHHLVIHCSQHVKSCILCQAKGFICEICNRETDIIFPFEFDKVTKCQECGSCFHKRCYKKGHCRKCLRIEERKKRREQIVTFSDEET